MTDLIRYDLLVQDALKTVVRRVLTDAARDGLPGEHHFYVSFRTDRPGVKLSGRLRERYPNDMTIVLQHQYDGLSISDTGFEVGLSFSGIPERLRVPFDALTGFFDPSVQFGLKFEMAEAEDAEAAEPAPALGALPASVPRIGGRRLEAVSDDAAGPDAKPGPAKAGKDKNADDKPAKDKPAKDKAGAADDGADGSAEVVSLDAFRRKP